MFEVLKKFKSSETHFPTNFKKFEEAVDSLTDLYNFS